MKYKTGLRKLFSYGGFYYSRDIDLTKRIVGEQRTPADNFWWNRELSKPLLASDISPLWSIKVIQGYVGH